MNWSAHEMMVLITSAYEPACTHDLAMAFASRINKVYMQVEEDSEQLLDI